MEDPFGSEENENNPTEYPERDRGLDYPGGRETDPEQKKRLSLRRAPTASGRSTVTTAYIVPTPKKVQQERGRPQQE